MLFASKKTAPPAVWSDSSSQERTTCGAGRYGRSITLERSWLICAFASGVVGGEAAAGSALIPSVEATLCSLTSSDAVVVGAWLDSPVSLSEASTSSAIVRVIRSASARTRADDPPRDREPGESGTGMRCLG